MAKTKFLIQYEYFRKEYEEYIILIQKGNFYIALYEDAEILANICSLKIKRFTTENISKCGFPVSVLEKYIEIINSKGYSVAICEEKAEYDKDLGIKKREFKEIKKIDKKPVYKKIDKDNKSIEDLVKKIKKLDINKITPIEALNILNKLKQKANILLGDELINE